MREEEEGRGSGGGRKRGEEEEETKKTFEVLYCKLPVGCYGVYINKC